LWNQGDHKANKADGRQARRVDSECSTYLNARHRIVQNREGRAEDKNRYATVVKPTQRGLEILTLGVQQMISGRAAHAEARAKNVDEEGPERHLVQDLLSA